MKIITLSMTAIHAEGLPKEDILRFKAGDWKPGNHSIIRLTNDKINILGSWVKPPKSKDHPWGAILKTKSGETFVISGNEGSARDERSIRFIKMMEPNSLHEPKSLHKP